MVHSASPWLTGDITDQCFFAASSNAGDLLSVVRGFQACCSRRHQCSGPAPDVAIVQPATRTAVATDLIEVEARIRDRGKGVGRIEWRVNRITAAVATKPEGAEGKFTIIRQLALDPGDNIVEVAAYNDGNLLASTPARTTVKLDRANETEKPTLHVLAIGINSYVDEGSPMAGGKVVGFLPLSSCRQRRQGAGGCYEACWRRCLCRRQGDRVIGRPRVGLWRSVGHRPNGIQINPRDTFVLFAAAHGVSQDGTFYTIPQDYDGGVDPAALQTRAISQSHLQDWLVNRIKAKRSVLLLDTCELGALVSGYCRSRAEGAVSDAAIGRLHEATGRPVLTAAAEGKSAFEGYEGHGVFTWALLDALRGGDRNGDRMIELSELVAHVQNQVPRIATLLRGRGRAAARGFADERQSARFGSRGGGTSRLLVAWIESPCDRAAAKSAIMRRSSLLGPRL